ncbi:MAG: 1-acyl-sn-glycerol-3-phosphate acyltransferase [Candidatus Melainabacteria bacterium]|nr:1-acyl-sn-glycerol-3-phosphate acyltransferase [Candidatus Melainabacteria bacterium]
MNIENILAALADHWVWLAVGLAVASFGLYVAKRYSFWKGEARKLLQGGYLPAPPTFLARLFFKLATRLIVFLVVGPVKVVGRKNARYDGRLLIAPNHTFQMDFAVTRTALPCHYTQIAKQAEVQGARAIIAAWVGTIAAKVEGGTAKPGQGAAVVKAAASYLASHAHTRLLLFPQGKLVYDNVLRPEDFRTGAARSLALAVEQLGSGEKVALLPVAIDYKRDPKNASYFHRFVKLLARVIPPLGKFRSWADVTRNADGTKTVTKFRNYGAVVVIGEPIPFASLPQDPHECSQFMRAKIQELLDQAEKL